MRFIIITLLAAAVASAVTPVPAGPIISRPGQYTDLQGRTLRFRPQSGGAYQVETATVQPLEARGTALAAPTFQSSRSPGWRVGLPFPFPFGGQEWREIIVNGTGSISFERPEAQAYPERDTWAAGTMREVAAAIERRSAAGQERMIAVHWGLNGGGAPGVRVWTSVSATAAVITWETQRYKFDNEGYGPLGTSFFQARLTPDGVIEMRFEQLPEKDGITGLFPGAPSEGTQLDAIDDPAGDATAGSPAGIDIRRLAVFDAGARLRFVFTIEDAPLERTTEGNLWYRVFLIRDGVSCDFGLFVNATSRSPYSAGCPAPAVRVSGKTIEVLQSKSVLAGVRTLTWGGDTIWAVSPGVTRNDALNGNVRRPLTPSPTTPTEIDLSASNGARIQGEGYEVFHYPVISKEHAVSASHVYRTNPAEDDMFVAVTDFRIDDLHNHGPSTGAVNLSLQGLGMSTARAGAAFGSTKLQVATGPIYLGPRFAEQHTQLGRTFRNHAAAVGWMAHELTHRWGVSVLSSAPPSNDRRGLLDTSCFCHWNDFLDTRSAYPVWKLFADAPYVEASPMAGGVYEEQANGTFVRQQMPYLLPSGFSHLDMYLAGLFGKEEVEPSFLIGGAQAAGNGVFRGTRIPVRIDDVIAASGERTPNVAVSQKAFRLGIYLLHEPGRDPDPVKAAEAHAIERNLIRYFFAATGGKMKVVSPVSPAVMRVASGADQTAVAGAAAEAPVVFEVVDEGGRPVVGWPVTLTAMNGALSEGPWVTDGRGACP